MGSNVQLSNLDMRANEHLQARFLSCTPPFCLSPVISLAQSASISVLLLGFYLSKDTQVAKNNIPVHLNHSEKKNV